MSQENKEIVRRWQAVMSASPEEALAAITEFFDANVDYYPVRKWPEAQPCHGREEFLQFIAGFQDAFSRDDWAIQELIDVGDDRVFARVSMRTEGRGSGLKLEGDLYQCFWLRHGRFLRIEDHLTLRGALHALGLQGETLEAAGLSERAMSEANVEIVRAVFEAWNAGDMDAVRDACDPEIILRAPEGWPESGPFFGQDALTTAFEQLRETFDSDWQELISDPVHVGDRVAVRTVWHGIGQGPELKQESTPVFTVRRGRVFHIEFFSDHAEALETMGLSE
jgi:ketosteroid isomerase-like protein